MSAYLCVRVYKLINSIQNTTKKKSLAPFFYAFHLCRDYYETPRHRLPHRDYQSIYLSVHWPQSIHFNILIELKSLPIVCNHQQHLLSSLIDCCRFGGIDRIWYRNATILRRQKHCRQTNKQDKKKSFAAVICCCCCCLVGCVLHVAMAKKKPSSCRHRVTSELPYITHTSLHSV